MNFGLEKEKMMIMHGIHAPLSVCHQSVIFLLIPQTILVLSSTGDCHSALLSSECLQHGSETCGRSPGLQGRFFSQTSLTVMNGIHRMSGCYFFLRQTVVYLLNIVFAIEHVKA